MKRLFLILFFVVISSSAFAQEYSEPNYPEIKAIVTEILKQYPAEEHYFLGIGRGPTPIIAFIQLMGISAENIPLSHFGYFPIDNEWGKVAPAPVEVKGSLMFKRIFEHFESYIPSAKDIGSKKLVIIDFSYTGLSIVSVHSFLKVFLEQKRSGIRLGMVTLQSGAGLLHLSDKYDYYMSRKGLVIDLGDYPGLDYAMSNSLYDEYSEFGFYNLLKPNPKGLVRRTSAYQAYKSLIWADLAIDVHLEGLPLAAVEERRSGEISIPIYKSSRAEVEDSIAKRTHPSPEPTPEMRGKKEVVEQYRIVLPRNGKTKKVRDINPPPGPRPPRVK